MCSKTTNKQIYLLQKYFLLIKEALDSSERPGDECVVDRSGDEAYILSEMASALCPEDPDHSTQAEKRSGSCSFV